MTIELSLDLKVGWERIMGTSSMFQTMFVRVKYM